jgi:protein SFI1
MTDARTDVGLLHEIVLQAQQRHDVQKRPKRALFEAYEKVFAENGLDTRQDRACLRIVLQLGEPQVPGDLLYDKFEFVLRQMGVNLAFRDEELPAHSQQQHGARSFPDEETVEKGARLQASPRRPGRRASFTSMQDITSEQIRHSRPQRLSRASESWLHDERAPLSMLEHKNISPYMHLEAKPGHRRRFSHEIPGSRRNGMNATHNERFHTSKKQQLPKDGNSELGVKVRLAEKFHGGEIFSDSESADSPRKLYAQELFYRPSPTDLDRDAAAFEAMRLRNLQRNLLNRWVRNIRERSEHIRALELQAVTKDFLTLKRQALDFWRTASDRKREQVREERFFEHLHRRAGQAYGLYLLTKSFTHWIQITAAAVAKTNAARQRFLFTKYFNAWYQFTVTNELKAERHGRRAPFDLLRKRAAQYYRDQINALEVYHGNLAKHVFWRWFREWCDRAAPRYEKQQIQRRTFNNWLRMSRKSRCRQITADSRFVRSSLGKAFRSWATKARVDVAGYHQADGFRKSRLLGTPFLQWHVEARLKPIADKVSRMRDWRIARSKFGIWQLRIRMVFRADAVNRMRTLQNAYSTWNERLRSQALAARTDERIVAEALYKWVIAQRYVLMVRISEQHQKKNAMRSFLVAALARMKELVPKEEELIGVRKQRLLGSTLCCWRERTVVIQTRSQIALDFYNPKLKQDTIEAIRLKIRSKQKLEMWAKDARFYFLMTRYITIWRAVAAERKKCRERAAHAKMRRKCKMNLARNILHAWSHKQHQNLKAYNTGDEVYLEKVKARQHELFRHWRTATSQREREAIQASERYDDRLLDHFLGLLTDTSRHLNGLQSRAEQFYHLKMSEMCSTQLRRFSMRAFEIRRREQDADAMHDRHWSKHVRNILRHWASKTQDVAYRDIISNAPTEKPQEREPTDAGYATASNEDHPQSTNGNELGATRRAEEWTAFDTELLEGSEWIPPIDDEPIATSTPMPAPGYLNTPSKRAARAKALANLSTTPATPLRTPFAARLRTGMGSSPSQGKATTARRGGPGFRSALGSNVTNSGEDD